MAEVLEKAAAAVKQRLAEIEDERKRLERALVSLSGERGGPGRPPGPSAAKPTGSRRRRRSPKRAERGQRERELAASIKANPNYRPADHARELGVAPSQVHGLLKKMSGAGVIKKGSDGTFKIS